MGSYLLLSRPWSPHRGRDWLIAGATTVRPNPSGGFAMDYVEDLPGGALVMTGAVRRIGRSLHVLLTSPDPEMLNAPPFTLPTAPALFLSGVIGGVTLLASEIRPRSRTLFVSPLASRDP